MIIFHFVKKINIYLFNVIVIYIYIYIYILLNYKSIFIHPLQLVYVIIMQCQNVFNAGPIQIGRLQSVKR